MHAHVDKKKENKSHLKTIQSIQDKNTQSRSGNKPIFQFEDNRRQAIVQRRLQEMANNSTQTLRLKKFQNMADIYSAERQLPIQKKVNNTGLPNQLKSGIENLSGYSLDDVKVRYNSDKPAQVQAHAFAQGTDIHLASGQEKYLPHEAWHVVQQKEGRVEPTVQMKGGTNVNNDTRKPIQLVGGKRKRKPSDDSNKRPKKKRKIQKYYTDKHFDFELSEDPEKEIYDNHVDKLIDGLDEDRELLEKYMALEEKGITTFGRQKINTLINKYKRNITEKVGELNATQYMDDNYPKAKLVHGFGKGVGFDQVYEKGDEIIIVEAKGPGAKLGTSDRKGRQMSWSWVRETARGMKDKKVKRKILEAKGNGKLTGLVITSTPGGYAPRKKLKRIRY